MKSLYDYVAAGSVKGESFHIRGFDAKRSKHNYTDELPERHPLFVDDQIVTLVETPEESMFGTIRFGILESGETWRGRNTARMLLVEPKKSD